MKYAYFESGEKRRIDGLGVPAGAVGSDINFNNWIIDQGVVREKTAREKNAGAIDDLIVDIKREAQDRIYVALPAWKQANYTARSIELLEKKGTVGLTVEEDGEIAFFKSQFELTKAIRAASNVIEAALIVSADPSAFNVSAAFDAALSNQ